MGHGDKIVFADAHFPGESLNKNIIRADGIRIPDLLEAVLPIFELDNYVGTPLFMMAAVEDDILDPQVEKMYFEKIHLTNPQIDIIKRIERFAFYERAKKAFDVLANTNINKENAKALADAAKNVWQALMNMNLNDFGKYFTQSFEAQIRMFPNMVNPDILQTIENIRDKALGCKLSCAGGGGYLVLVAENKIEGMFKIKIRR